MFEKLLPNKSNVLNKGINTIQVFYKNKKPDTVLRVNVLSYKDNDNVLNIISHSSAGTIEKTFVLESSKPKDFTSIVIEQ